MKEQLAAINESQVACSTEEIHIEAIGPPHHLDRVHDLGEPYKLRWNGTWWGLIAVRVPLSIPDI